MARHTRGFEDLLSGVQVQGGFAAALSEQHGSGYGTKQCNERRDTAEAGRNAKPVRFRHPVFSFFL
jgi:hypothetical protein